MAMDMFMVVSNDVEGETKDKTMKDKKAIDVLAWSWGLSNSGSAHMGGGQGAGKVNVQDLSFTKYIDKASTKLQLFCANGQHVDTATLTVRKAGGDKPVDYMVISMEDCLISSVSTGGSGGEDRLTENVSLNFAKVKVEYKIQDDKGIGKTGGEYTWDIAANSKEG